MIEFKITFQYNFCCLFYCFWKPGCSIRHHMCTRHRHPTSRDYNTPAKTTIKLNFIWTFDLKKMKIWCEKYFLKRANFVLVFIFLEKNIFQEMQTKTASWWCKKCTKTKFAHFQKHEFHIKFVFFIKTFYFLCVLDRRTLHHRCSHRASLWEAHWKPMSGKQKFKIIKFVIFEWMVDFCFRHCI